MTTATHTALIYAGDEHYATDAGRFLREGPQRGNRGLVVAMPPV